MKDNSESALFTNKEAISNAAMNLMESSILAPLIMKYRLLVEPYELCESKILQIRESKSFIKHSWWNKMWMKDPIELNWVHESKQ